MTAKKGNGTAWGVLGKTKLKRYLLKWYGWRDMGQIMADTGANTPETVYGWARALDVLPVHEREGVLGVKEVAAKLGVSPNVVYGWVERGLIPHRQGWRGTIPVRVCLQPEIERWLMRPKPAWMLIDFDKVQDRKWRIILRNAQELNDCPWLKTKEAAEKYNISKQGLLWHSRQGKIARFEVRRQYWLYEPDIRRTLGVDYVGSSS